MGGSLHSESAVRITQILLGAAIVAPIAMFLDRTGRWAFATGCLTLVGVISAIFFLPDDSRLGFGALALAMALLRGSAVCGLVGVIVFVLGIVLQRWDES
jgi:hypothetical protein